MAVANEQASEWRAQASQHSSRASSGRRQREGSGPEKDAKRLRTEPKPEPSGGVNGALVATPRQHVVQHVVPPVCPLHDAATTPADTDSISAVQPPAADGMAACTAVLQQPQGVDALPHTLTRPVLLV